MVRSAINFASFIGLFILMLGGCGNEQDSKTTENRIVDSDDQSVTHATVYTYQSRATSFGFDRSATFQMIKVDSLSVYRIEDKSFDAVIAFAPDYYPALSRNGGKIVLNQVPKEGALKRQSGVVRIYPNGNVHGFSFVEGLPVESDKADFFPLIPSNEKALISNFKANEQGGFLPLRERFVPVGLDRLTADINFYNALVAPRDGYKNQMNVREDSMWFIRTRDGSHYAKVIFSIHMAKTDGSREYHFDYVYQPMRSQMLKEQFSFDLFSEQFR